MVNLERVYEMCGQFIYRQFPDDRELWKYVRKEFNVLLNNPERCGLEKIDQHYSHWNNYLISVFENVTQLLNNNDCQYH